MASRLLVVANVNLRSVIFRVRSCDEVTYSSLLSVNDPLTDLPMIDSYIDLVEHTTTIFR